VTVATIDARRSTRALAVAAAVGLALRLLFAIGYWTDRPLTRDEREYLSLARGIASGRGLVYDAAVLESGSDPFGRAPGYPLFLALTGSGQHVTTAVPSSVKIAQSIVGALGVLAVGVLAAGLAGSRAGVAAALIAAVYPPLVWIAGYAYSEALAWPIGMAALLMFDRSVSCAGARGHSYGAIAGLASAALVLIRPSSLLFVVLALLWLLMRRVRRRSAAAFLAGAMVLLLPWTIRNYRHYDRLVIVASEGGVTFWTGNHPLATGEGDLAANPELKRAATALRSSHPDLTEEQMEPIYYHQALLWISTHPFAWLWLEMKKIVYLALPIGPSYKLHSFRYYALSVLSYAAILPAAAIGFWQLGYARRRSPGLWLLAGSAVLASVIFFPQERFRIPILDPTLVICAATLFGRAGAHA
jgi:4-amino-4-deoxy-L-arabinose transferase-like glycosyltransferase